MAAQRRRPWIAGKGRRPWIAGNWKMHKTIPEALELVRALKAALSSEGEAEVVVAPPFTALQAVGLELQGSAIRLAAQNVHWKEAGAFTGEISPVMLRDLGCDYCIIGHSERRQWFREDDALIHQKLSVSLKAGIQPIFCLGETLEQREAGQVREVVSRQFLEAFRGLSPEDAAAGVIAYEPVWAIGTGRTATPEAAQEVHALIRSLLQDTFNKRVALEKRIVYGGSVTPETMGGLIAQPDIDGALVGGASLKADSFMLIVKEAA